MFFQMVQNRTSRIKIVWIPVTEISSTSFVASVFSPHYMENITFVTDLTLPFPFTPAKLSLLSLFTSIQTMPN